MPIIWCWTKQETKKRYPVQQGSQEGQINNSSGLREGKSSPSIEPSSDLNICSTYSGVHVTACIELKPAFDNEFATLLISITAHFGKKLCPKTEEFEEEAKELGEHIRARYVTDAFEFVMFKCGGCGLCIDMWDSSSDFAEWSYLEIQRSGFVYAKGIKANPTDAFESRNNGALFIDNLSSHYCMHLAQRNQEENREANITINIQQEESRENSVTSDIKLKCESDSNICKKNDIEKIYKGLPEDKNQWEPASSLICNEKDIVTKYWDRIEQSVSENSNNYQKPTRTNSESSANAMTTTRTTSTTLKRPRDSVDNADDNNSRKKEKKTERTRDLGDNADDINSRKKEKRTDKQIPFQEFASDDGIWENVIQEIVTVDYESSSSCNEEDLIVYVKWRDESISSHKSSEIKVKCPQQSKMKNFEVSAKLNESSYQASIN
ncbi:11584_t:CDS:10 [Ambispora gerdemannii]|uniref:11584_t:CDS:1 n=1 Tax=Ambispora gerdemannii TaxID=144530 RepID=A0A9N8W8V5_9GLOM|nr:11584_t:CDS:10 [Ambispora gerdemannii]